ncbi:MAG: DUF1071 domain-containing protein [Streptococcaceae bacterium]|jgi:hypothetical protein|nr:DUF1071 domain-containing protein [Streptococcaceae bacterium]
MNDHSKFIPDTNATNVLNFEFTPTDPNDINYRLLENGMNLSYISWAKAWKMLKEKYPNANYRSTPTEIFGTKFMRVEVTNGYIAHEEHYPVHAWNGTEITQDDINIAIRRGLTKAIAHFGIGLDLYIQEDSEMQKKDMLLDANKALEEIVALSIKLGKPTDFKSLV